MDLVTLPGVFAPISDSWLLARTIGEQPIGPGSEVLDVCTGSGVLALAAAATGASVTAVDVSRRALVTVRINAWRQRLPVAVRRGRGFEPVAGRRFDLIVSNPPYVPAPSSRLPERGPSRAWEAGPTGRVVLDALCADAPRHLRPGGSILIVHSSVIGEDRTAEALQAAGLDVDVVARERGPLGPLMRAQQETGLVDPSITEEDVVVIRGTASGR